MPPGGRIDVARRISWATALPVGLLALALAVIAYFDVTAGGDAKPPPLLGAIGTPIRGTFTPPTPTPIGARPTPRPRPTVAGAPGTAAERDQQRRRDLLRLLGAFDDIRRQTGAYPDTGGNIQTLCVYEGLDVGCIVGEVLGDVPEDPLGRSAEFGYWYQSDGQRMTLYAALEEDIPDEERCPSDYIEFEDKVLVCLHAP
jgi:hypothetical protein